MWEGIKAILKLISLPFTFLWGLINTDIFKPVKWLFFIAIGLGIIAIIKDEKKKKEEKQRIEWEKEQAEKEEHKREAERNRILKAQEDELKTKKEAAKPRLIENKIRMQKVETFFQHAHEEYIAFDTETTGLDSELDAIIELSAVRVVNDVITEEFNTFVKPPFKIPAKASEINHITDDMVASAPTIETVLHQFLEFVGKTTCIAHNAKFDSEFIAAAADRAGLKIKFSFADSLAIAQKYWPELCNKKLGTVADAIGYTNLTPHRALGDAKTVHAIITAAYPRIERYNLEKKYDLHCELYRDANALYRDAKDEDLYSPEIDHVIDLYLSDIRLAKDVLKYAQITGIENLMYQSFQKLAIIFEKRKEYSRAIGICKQALELGFVDDGTKAGMQGRLEKLSKKLEKDS